MSKSAVILAITLSLGCASLSMLPACSVAHAASQKEEADEAGETKVKLADCPKAVQDALAREAGGAVIADVDKESEKGKTIYEADATIGGKNYEIKVAEDGTLVSKKIDDEKEEGDKEGDKEEKGEHEDKK